MAGQSLRDELLALPGVAEVEVEGEGPSPAAVRIRLAAGADAEVVGAEVQRVLAARGMRSRVDAGEAPLPAPLPQGAPASPPAAAPGPAAGLGSVILEESASSLAVTVSASDGRRVTRRAGISEPGLEAAVIEAVGVLLDGAPPRVMHLEWATVEGLRVVTLVLESSGGAKGAGSGLVRASTGYAVARAAWSALTP